MYKCVMVVAYLYGYNRHGDRHRDREIWRHRVETERFNLLAYCLELIGRLVVGCRVVVLLWFSLAQIFASIKKFFNFPNFFPNYLIINAFHI